MPSIGISGSWRIGMTDVSGAGGTVLEIDRAITLGDVAAVAYEHRPVRLTAAALGRIGHARDTVDQLLRRNWPVYGLTTGVGALKRVPVAADAQSEFNRRLLLSHRTGTGPDVDNSIIRATLLAQVAGFAQGHAGVSETLAELIVAALNADLRPRARTTGSLGQSDLGTMADIAEALTGWGEWASELNRLGLEPWRPDAKESLAFVNSNAFSLGSAALAVSQVASLLDCFDQAAALTFEGMLGNVQALDPDVAIARPIPGLAEAVQRLRRLLEGGDLLSGSLHRQLQDPLTMRVVPQTHGAARVALASTTELVEAELGSSHDNPCITDDGRALSNGNFDSTPYGIALDHLRLAIAHVATASCERSQKLVHSAFSGLPTGLRHDDGSSSDGLAIVVYGAAAAAAEVRMLAMPVSLETPTTSVAEGIEDRIIPTPVAARRLDQQIQLALHVAATELYAAAQAVDLRDRVDQLGDGTRALHELVRRFAPSTMDGEPPMADLSHLATAMMRANGHAGSAASRLHHPSKT
jgi:histidine ammonia-lyase